jgi:hypothetical protein
MRAVAAGVGVILAFAVAASARADSKPAPPALEGMIEVGKYSSATGFVDDAVTGDADHIAYVVSDASTASELHVVTLLTKVETVVDLAPITLHPVALELVGARAFVVGATEDGNQVAALVELADKTKGKPVYKLGPATHITVLPKGRVAVYRATTTKTGTRHEVEVVAIDSGRRITAGHPLELDGNDKSAALGFHVNHWADGMTRAFGIKDGEYNRKEDTRAPDAEASYDLLTGKFDVHPITDLFEQHKRYQALHDAAAGLDFLRMSWDLGTIQVWSGGKPHDAALDQPLQAYDAKSLQGIVAADGSAWFALKIDPVNPDAVARQKADPEYLDIFHATPDGKATRKARLLAVGARHRLGVIDNQIWLIERNKGFERGGKALTVYKVQ